jgi:phosphatidylinositol alpha-1,6-mannosyltransferase
MKICYVASNYAPSVGGLATFSTHLTRALSEQSGVEHVQVIVLQGAEVRQEHASSTLDISWMPLGSLLTTFRTLWRELKRYKDYDVFHSPNVFPVGFFTLLVAHYWLKKPVVISFFGTDLMTQEGSWLTKWAKGFTLRHASRAVALTRSTRDLVAARYHVPSERFPVGYYPLPPHEERTDVPDIRAECGYSADDFIVLTVGKLVARKGVDDLIRAIGRVSDSRVKLLVVGGGPERETLEGLVRAEQLEHRVRFAGRVEDVDAFYHHADLFALTSYIRADGDVEGFGIVFVEAQLHMVPVLGTRSGGIPETMDEGKTGLLVPERDVPAIAAAIERFAGDPDLCRRLGEAGAAYVDRAFDPGVIAGEYIRIYTSA